MCMDLRELRSEKKITISNLSQQLKISEKRIKIVERGLDIPSLSEVRKITDYFEIPEIDIEYFNKRKKALVVGEGYVTAKGANQKIYEPKNIIKSNKLKVLDLFSGIGGLSYGFEMTDSFQTIGGLDLLDDRIQTFTENHKSAYGFCFDINETNPSVLEPFLYENPNIIVGGAPCQGFSSIRPFRGLNENDKRNDLFKSYAIYLNHFKPDWFVFENVVGLLTHKNGDTLKILLREFESIGYKVDFRILNTAYYGVPQFRERLIVVGNKNKIKFDWPKPTHYYDYNSMAGINNEYVLKPNKDEGLPIAIPIMDALSDLPALKSGEKSTKYLRNELSEYQIFLRNESAKLTLHEATIHSEKMLEIIKQSGYNINAVKHLVTSGFSSSYSRLEPDRPSVTLTVNFVNPSSNKCIHPIQNRALTPREGARIQGFPDKFSFKGTKTQIVKQIGNAVPPVFSRKIAEEIFKYY